ILMLRPLASGISRVSVLHSLSNLRQNPRFFQVLALVILCACVAFAAISIPIGTPYTQNFDGMGIPATISTPSTLPADFKVDNPATVRTLGTFAAASTTVARAGGANLSTT